MRRSAPGMSPEKIAIAVQLTMAATAGTGGMKNVTGTSSAVAMVAVRPGIAPTNRPNSEDARITPSTYGSATSAKASSMCSIMRCPLPGVAGQHTPGQRNLEQRVEDVVHQRGHDHRDRQCDEGPGSGGEQERRQRDRCSDEV